MRWRIWIWRRTTSNHVIYKTSTIVVFTNEISCSIEDLSSFFITDLVRGQRYSDDNFLQVASTYKDTLLEKFPMPRYSIPEADVNVAVAINAAIPRLEVVAGKY
jgi:hypothetical protein